MNDVIVDAANTDELDEKAKAPVVQQKGRFKVTSENVDLEKVVSVSPDCMSDFKLRLQAETVNNLPFCFQVVPIPILQKSHSLQVRSFEVSTIVPKYMFSSCISCFIYDFCQLR